MIIKNKYHSKKVTYKGIKFDSKKEMQRYKDLELLESTDYICNLELQKKFLLQEGYTNAKGKKIMLSDGMFVGFNVLNYICSHVY